MERLEAVGEKARAGPIENRSHLDFKYGYPLPLSPYVRKKALPL
jgi:hypothetical protein